MVKCRVIQSGQVSKEGYCFRYCLVQQRTVCIINVWGYTEILLGNYQHSQQSKKQMFRSQVQSTVDIFNLNSLISTVP